MINRRIKLHRFHALGIGLSAVCLALGCGSDDKPSDDADVSVPPDVEPVNECLTNPYLRDCPGNDDGAGTGTGTGTGTGGGAGSGSGIDEGGGQGAEDPGPPTPERLARDQVQNILLTNCGGCHGTQLTQQSAQAGMNYINDMDKLVANKRVIPLDAEASPIIVRMRNRSMPPANLGGQAVASEEIDIVANYINNGDFWPDIPKASCSDNPPMDFDELYSDVAGDLRDQRIEDQPFIRYVSLDNRVGAGICANTTLDIDRQALTKMLNSLSIDPKVVKPGVVNSDETLFRIDLRDVQWDREVTVDGQTFPDVWEAIVNANAYAVPFEGDQADDARGDAQTEVPVMFLDSMLDSATIGNLYYAIIGVDVTQSLDTFVSDELLIDVAEDLANEEVVRAGTTKSRISRQDRLIEGHDIGARAGVYYQSFDFADVQNESIFQNPFGFNEGGSEAIFTLPNGMLGYLIADENGNLVEDSDILLDASQNNYRAITSVSCANCHASGFIPVIDEVRASVERNALTLLRDGTLDQEQFEALSVVYPEPEAFARRMKEESQTFYLSALGRADLPVNGVEPVFSVFMRFDRDMKLADAAGDLGIDRDELADVLELLDPALGVLDGGTIDRDDFTQVYLANLCTVSIANVNRPQQAICDAALAGN